MIKTLPRLYKCYTVDLGLADLSNFAFCHLTMEFEWYLLMEFDRNTSFRLASTAPSCVTSVICFCTDHPTMILPKFYEHSHVP
mgnify:CR=1 FL=1